VNRRVTVVLLIFYLAAAASCRREGTFAYADRPHAGDDEIAISATHVHRRRDHFILNLELANRGERPAGVAGDVRAAFTLRLDDSGLHPRAVLDRDVGTVLEDVLRIPPGGTANLQVRWRFPEPLEHARYRWRLDVEGLRAGDDEIARLSLEGAGDSCDCPW